VVVEVTVTNGGAAGTVSIEATLPPGVSLQGATPEPASGTTWQLDLAAGATATIEVTLGVSPKARIR